MSKKTLFLILAALVLLLIIVFWLREADVLNLNFYKSEAATNRILTSGLTRPQGDKSSPGYTLHIFYDGEPVATSARSATAGAPTFDIPLAVTTVISGNDWMPLNKAFSVDFSAPFTSTVPGTIYALEGNLKGTTQIKVIGLCTRRQAQRLARDEIIKEVQAAFANSIK